MGLVVVATALMYVASQSSAEVGVAEAARRQTEEAVAVLREFVH